MNQREKFAAKARCSACGAEFACGVEAPDGCWCTRLPGLPANGVVAGAGCLCGRCLLERIAAASGSPAVADPAGPMSIALSIDDLRTRVGHEVAVSDWFTVTQAVINEFAATTRDTQWIHVDTERAARESPFRNADGQRCTVAHGFLTLALLTPLFESGLTITGARAGVNIGFERLRFEGPVPAGSRIRGHFTLAEFEDVRGGAQLNWDVSVGREQDARVVLSARWLTRVWR